MSNRVPTRSGRKASQYADELGPFIGLLQERSTTSYLEVGARHGDTFFTVMTALPMGSRGVAVDLGGGPWGTPASVAALRDAVAELTTMGYLVDAVFGDSRSPQVIREVRSILPAYDAVLIDGDHRYHGVKADWENYGPLAPVIGFHDIAGAGVLSKKGRLPVEVPRLWSEIKATGVETLEFIGAARDCKMGIGVVLR